MVAARTGATATDPRVTCPVCGGQIHPIAGRCKHCRTDLSAMRGGGGHAAPAALPALGAGAPIVVPAHAAAAAHASPYAGGQVNGHANGHAAYAPAGAALPAAASMVAVRAAPTESTWSRRWPILVVVLAAIVIVVSVVLLLQGDKPASSKIKRPIQPSMDNNMNTNPMVPDDPWGGPPTVPPSTQPSAPPGTHPPGVPPDPGGGAAGVPGGTPGTGPTDPDAQAQFRRAMFEALCGRLKTCGQSPAIDALCNNTVLEQLTQGTSCRSFDPSAGSACLARLRDFPCVDDLDSLDASRIMGLFDGFSECSQACE